MNDERADRMEQALRNIETWAKAYPVSVFPEPDLQRAAEVLALNGMTLDAISAHVARHILDGVIDTVRRGLGE